MASGGQREPDSPEPAGEEVTSRTGARGSYPSGSVSGGCLACTGHLALVSGFKFCCHHFLTMGPRQVTERCAYKSKPMEQGEEDAETQDSGGTGIAGQGAL